ncbi:MAG: helix-turn-helix domain-containing protein [Candidatus Lernaella stagnicola]|nr:helix-turn-helix domain-containing protein [Candidatus Lernaella stagnicola]
MPANQEAKELQALFSETAFLFLRLKALAEEIHGEETTASIRGILYQLAREGAGTVPRMARRRSVSRQYIQSIVNGLLERDLVTYKENPHHRKSKLVVLTPAGTRLVDRMNAREAELLQGLPPTIGVESVQSATRVLAEVRQWFESAEWRATLQNEAAKGCQTRSK